MLKNGKILDNNGFNNSFFSLVRRGIGNDGTVLSDTVDWRAVEALAQQQGLSAIVLDGVEAFRNDGLPASCLPEKKQLTRWIGQVLQGYEHRYELYRRVIAEMAGFYNSHGYRMMVLKGYACSMTWPKPEHRPLGDIDIWQFGDYKKADALLASKKGIIVDRSHHHHTVFHWRGFVVENHYDFVNVHRLKSNVQLESEFKKLGEDDTHYVELSGERVYIPSPNLHALFLIKHAMSDFSSCSVSIRQILDWAFHVKRYGKEIDWDWLNRVLTQYHMIDFCHCINAICVEELGFDSVLFHSVQFNPSLKEKVLDDILHPRFSVSEPSGILSRLVYKFRRWRANKWKHKLCYKESVWSSFWSGIWNHLLKPSRYNA